jgi:hypothetical protein
MEAFQLTGERSGINKYFAFLIIRKAKYNASESN